jgi:hypothetical protein
VVGADGGVIDASAWSAPSLQMPDRFTARVRAVCRGAAPYIVNAVTEERVLDIGRGAPALQPPEPPRPLNPAARGLWDWRWLRANVAPCCVEQRDGVAGIRGEHLLRCLIETGIYEPYEGRMKLTDEHGSRVPSLVRVGEDFLPFPDDCQAWVADCRYGLRRGKRVRLARAKFLRWGFTATLAFDPERFSVERLRHLVWVAGYRVGLGSFRKDPRRDRIRAVFGRFKIVGWDILADGATAKAAQRAINLGGSDDHRTRPFLIHPFSRRTAELSCVQCRDARCSDAAGPPNVSGGLFMFGLRPSDANPQMDANPRIRKFVCIRIFVLP